MEWALGRVESAKDSFARELVAFNDRVRFKLALRIADQIAADLDEVLRDVPADVFCGDPNDLKMPPTRYHPYLGTAKKLAERHIQASETLKELGIEGYSHVHGYVRMKIVAISGAIATLALYRMDPHPEPDARD